MNAFFDIMLLPLAACLILTGIHVYLGLHVIQRQVIFVDLALAQIAALGASLAILFHWSFDGPEAYWLSLGFTLAGAAVFSLSRFRKQRVPQEAVIGIVYAVSAALLLLVLSGSGEGDEHMRHALIGNILLVSKQEITHMLAIYSVIGIIHYIFRRKFLLISSDPESAYRQNINVRLWDFLFYALFGIVVTSSVKLAGVLLVFSFLVVPACCSVLFFDTVKKRLLFGWAAGFTASVLGMLTSYFFDLPTGASVIGILGFLLLSLGLIKKFGRVG